MTKATPASAGLRSSSRISANKTNQKTANSVSKPANKQSSIKKMKRKVASEISKNSVVKIHDFKRQSGQTMYLVEREGPSDKTWETEDMIESVDVLSAYQQKVLEESGYSIDEQNNVTEQNQLQQENSRQKFTRASKIRAVIAMKQTDLIDEDTSENSNRGTKRKSIIVNGSTKKPANKRMTKAEQLLESQREERLERKQHRKELNLESIACEMDHLNVADCCLQCGANAYRTALENNDMGALKKALKSNDLPHHSSEDKPNGLGFIEYAIVLQREKFADELLEFYKNNPKEAAPTIPQKYIVYDGGNTGRNNRVGEYNRRAFRQVEESRGNRIGNSTFYRDQNSTTPRNTYMNVEDQMRYSAMRPFMPYVSTPVFQNAHVIENYSAHFKNGSHEVYFAVASGSRLFAKNLLQHAKSLGRPTFNHLHEEVLSFENDEPLTNYRKPQILKMASDAFNASPYHFSAINPSSKYLIEFFEALDPAERLETDALGRSIAFYAAVSETSACLEFIESQGINLSLVDKYKMSPLIQAARYGRSHNVELLIKHLRGGSDVTEVSPIVFQTLNRNRRTALHYAAFFGHAETCRVLIKYGAPVECIESLDKQTPLIFAAKNGYVDCVRVLIEEGKSNPEKGDKFSRTALHYACINGHMEVVKYLLSQGVNSNAADSSNNTPAHFASAFGYLKILNVLIKYGSADPSVCNVWRSTPCSVANMKGHIAIVKYLLNLPNTSIDVNFKDQEGRIMLQNNINESADTPIEKKNTLEKINLLLSMNADVNSVDLEGNTSLHTLVSNNSFIKLAPKNWGTVYAVNTRYYNKGLTTQDMMDGMEYQLSVAKLLVQHGANLNAKNSDNETPLALAIRKSNNYLIAYLVEAGSKFWVDADMHGHTLFHYIGKLASYISQIQCHNENLTIARERQLEALRQIWAAVDKLSFPHMNEIKKIINTPSNDGLTPLIFCVNEAINDQKKAMIREKRMILAAVSDASSSSSYGSNSGSVYPGPKFEEIPKPMKVDLTFNFKIWIVYMSKMLTKFQPDMNCHIVLPKDFKKKKPKAKKADYPTHTGYTALHLAADTQCTDLIEFLLENGSSPNEIVKVGNETLSGDTPLIIAYRHKKDLFQEVPSQSMEYTEKVKKIFEVTKPNFKDMLNATIKTFIKFGGCPYLANSKETSAVLKASSCADVINLAVMCGAKPSPGTDVNIQNEHGETALMAAIKSFETKLKSNKKDVEVDGVRSLLKAKADPNVKFEDGNTVLMRVVKTSHAPLLATLLFNTVVPIDHDIQNRKHETALMIACKLNNTEIISTYIQYSKQSSSHCELNVFDTDMGTPLSYAAKNGDLNIVHEMLSLGANPNFNKPQHIPLIDAVLGQNIAVVDLLLKHGAHIDVQDDSKGNTPLHTAVLVEKHQIVKLLLESGANFNLQNARRQTPMHLAVEVTKKQTNRSFRVEHLLMKAGADMNVTDFFGRTPLHYVFVDSELIPITRNTSIISKKVKQISKEMKIEQDRAASLRQYAENFDLNELAGKSSEEENYLNTWIKQAKEIQLDLVQEEERKKETKEHKEDEQVIILEEEKGLIKTYSTYGWETEALIPARFDPIDILKYLSDIEGLNYDAKDDFGRTPLHYAACVGAFSCTSLLISKNVDINALDSDNNGPVQLALRNNYVDYSVMLCNFGAIVNNDIVLKDGVATSTFGFSLSKSLINMAYLIMDRGVTLIESIKDALKNGKFHMVEILLQSAKDDALSQTLPSEGQNMWHIISDFKPFNHEIWEEYIEDIVGRLSTLNLPMTQDNFRRTPIHYAAKHGQTVLLRRYLSLDNIIINIEDVDGKSELCYAVEAGNVDSVMELLKIAPICDEKISNLREESLVLKSVKANQFRIAELLLENGFSSDEDSFYGRINAVMVACQNNYLEILQLLIKHGADLDKPSHVERKDKSGNKYTVLLHPIFAASVSGNEILKAMLKAGANPNVYGPDSKPEYGRSCFMYNVALDNIENQKILLNFNLDLNAVDTNASRTIFYQFFFSIKKNGKKFKNMASEHDLKLIFHDSIYEKMIQKFSPQVNFVDKFTGMTPLELSIHEKNTVVVERLLHLGADANAESGVETSDFVASNILNPNNRKLPAFIHAVNENSLELVKLVCSKTSQINWIWHDEDNRNVISYIIGNKGGFSHENVEILNFIAEEMKINQFKKLIRMRDIDGKTPVQYAVERENTSLYDTILKIDPTSNIRRHVAEDAENEEDSSMDIDYITTQKVDEDAQIEREILQSERDLEKAKTGVQDKKDVEIPKVDPYSNLQKVGAIMLDEKKQAYDIMLIKVEVRGWGVYTDTSFYKMSIIKNKVLNLYVLWTRWGSYGDEGQHQKTPYLNLEEAVAEFRSIFRSKTGNSWEDRLTNFQQKQGRYELLKTSKHPRDNIIKNFDFLDSKLPLQLPLEVANLMKLICSYKYLSKVYSDSCIDMPLGQIPQRTLDRAQNILKDVAEMSKKRIEAGSHYSDRAKIQEAKMWDFKIAQQCVEYARLLPRNDEQNKPIRSLFDNNGENLKSEYARMADLSYVGFAANVLLAAKHHINEINPLEYAYHTLNCSFRNVTSETGTAEYQLVKNFMQSTSHGNHELVHLMAVNRAEEEKRFRPFEKEANRQLLWHGSRVGNFMGILKQGLRISPRTSSSNGAMLGNGVYFADTFAKSLNYATDFYGDQNSAYKLLLLCEVALGSKTEIYEPYNYQRRNKEHELHSMKGEGSNIPDPDNAVYDANGVLIPMGPCIPYSRPVSEDDNNNTSYGFGSRYNNNNAPLLNHNEYAVYDEDRVKIRYLLIIRESSICFLCSKSDKASLKPLNKHDVKDHNYSYFNNFEAELVKAYLTHTNKTPQSIFDEDLEEYIDSGLYKKQWNIPLELSKDSQVCKSCAHNVTSILLEKKLTDNEADIPDLLKIKPCCKYGKECRTQSKVAHAKKYQHWFKPNVSDEVVEPSNNEKETYVDEDEEKSDSDDEDSEEEDEDEDDEDSMDTDEE